jgi:prepilin-type N-terminal cleavage/methylation domain-containing protein
MPLLGLARGQLKKGFSLLELLVVVALIGILGAIGIPIYKGYITRAKSVDAVIALRSISAAQEKYKVINGVYFSNTVAGPSLASSAEISSSLLNNASLNTVSYYFYIPPLANCASPPVRTPTRPARQFCALASSLDGLTTYTIDQTDNVNDQLNNDVNF